MSYPEQPYTRQERYLDAIARGETDGLPAVPNTRLEMYLDAIARNGGGGGGAVIAGKYDATTAYAIGDHTINSGKLYVKTSGAEAAEEWTPAHWTEVTVGEEISQLSSSIADGLQSLNNLKAAGLVNETKDETTAYQKTVPADALPNAVINSVSGRTLVMNQLARQAIRPDDKYGWGPADMVIDGNNASRTYRNANYWLTEVQKGHKLYVSFGFTLDVDGTTTASINAGGTVASLGFTLAANVKKIVHKVLTMGSSYSDLYFYPNGASSSDDTVTMTISDLIIIDLTLMYGAGNEPSEAECVEIFAEGGYAFDKDGTETVFAPAAVVSQYNILPKCVAGTYTSHGVTATVDADGVITMSEESSEHSGAPAIHIPLEKLYVVGRGYYHIGNNSVKSSVTASLYDSVNNKYGSNPALSPKNRIVEINETNYGTACNEMYLWIAADQSVAGLVIKPMVKADNAATPYAPYTAPVTYPIGTMPMQIDVTPNGTLTFVSDHPDVHVALPSSVSFASSSIADVLYASDYRLINDITVEADTTEIILNKTSNNEDYDFTDMYLMFYVPTEIQAGAINVRYCKTADYNFGKIINITYTANNTATNFEKRTTHHVWNDGGVWRNISYAWATVGNVAALFYPQNMVYNDANDTIKSLQITPNTGVNLPEGMTIKVYVR